MTLVDESKRKYSNSNRSVSKPHKLSYRHSNLVKKAIEMTMEMYSITKSEALDMIIEEWLYHVAGK